jgi:protein involved in polysaccharide export with SLBB domain
VLKIYGEVQYPGTYQYADGTTLEDIVLQAGGLKESASQTVKVSRRTLDTNTDGKASDVATQTYEMKLKDGFVIDGEQGFVLQPYDEIYVTKDPLFKKLTSVTIEGEVFTEGTFSMSQTNTRVSDVLKMCGGVTSRAAKNGTYILRKMNEEEKRVLVNKTIENRAGRAYHIASGQSASGGNEKQIFADSLYLEFAMRTNLYKVAVDLQASIKNPGSPSDVILRDGDRIIVEEARNTVRISGAVPYENTVPYIEGKNIKYYMAQGGSRGFKDRKWAYVVYQNGTAQMVKDGAKVEPGCEIVLPERNTSSNSQSTALWVSIGSTIATMAAVVVSAMRK